MGVMSIADLQAVLRPHAGKFGRSVWPIWGKYLELPEDHRLAFAPIAEANVLQSYMVQRAKAEFLNVSGVRFLEVNGFHLGIDGSGYGVDGSVVCRFKKLSEDGSSRNYPTERAEALRRNEPLPGIPDGATYVDVGYVLNPLRTGISLVQVVRLCDSQLVFSIPASGGQISHINESLPFGPMVVERRFTLLNGAKKKIDGTESK